MDRTQKIQRIAEVLARYTYPKEQLGFVSVQDVCEKILEAIGE